MSCKVIGFPSVKPEVVQFDPSSVTEKPPQNHSQGIPSFPSPEHNQEQEKDMRKRERP